MAQGNTPGVFITTNGCRRRALDSGRLADYFRLNGCRVQPVPQGADYLLVVTCSFIQMREDECWKILDELKPYGGEIIVLGCLPEIARESFLQRFHGRYLVTKDLDQIDSLFPAFRVKYGDVPDGNRVFGEFGTTRQLKRTLWQKLASLRLDRRSWNALQRAIRARLGENTPADLGAAHLRVSYGCVSNCAYCSIRKATGKLKSKTLDACAGEYRRLLGQGWKDFVILADDVGAYGLDIRSSFAELLRRLSEEDAGRPVGWQLRELHPNWAVKYRDEILTHVSSGKVNHILCPVQSGSPKILKLMNRFGDADKVRDTLIEFRKAGLRRLDSHMIVGFPQETEEDFRASVEMAKAVRFDHVNVFPFWAGYGTIASKMDGQVDPRVTQSRIDRAVKEFEAAGMRISWDTPR